MIKLIGIDIYIYIFVLKKIGHSVFIHDIYIYIHTSKRYIYIIIYMIY
jgi:hypothetical protein